MNQELVKKLIEDATVQTTSLGAYGEDCFYMEVDPELLIELVVEKCAFIADDCSNHYMPASTYGAEIKKRFGVI